jgi:ubiquinone/menaquinone biosynthesis C-methylase UbiE
MDTYQKVLFTIILLLCVNYFAIVWYNRLVKPRLNSVVKLREGFSEGFTSEKLAQGTSPEEKVHVWLDNKHIYDNFYAEIYDTLTSSGNRTRAEAAFCVKRWAGKTPTERMRILDIGCGTGHAPIAMVVTDVGKVCGLDLSAAMLAKARANQETDKKAKSKMIEWREGNAEQASTCQPNEFTHATLFYFSIYYIENKPAFFKNLYNWIAPGGGIAIEVVNKYKFDPMFQSAAPFLGFSLQKYVNERVNTSKIAFNKFDYEGTFNLLEEGDKSEAAEFREVFTFKDSKTVRRHKHRLLMPDMKEMIKAADAAGFQYMGYQDLMTLGFEYAYLLFFDKH